MFLLFHFLLLFLPLLLLLHFIVVRLPLSLSPLLFLVFSVLFLLSLHRSLILLFSITPF